MREHVRSLIRSATEDQSSSSGNEGLGTAAVRLARVACAMHAAEAGRSMGESLRSDPDHADSAVNRAPARHAPRMQEQHQ